VQVGTDTRPETTSGECNSKTDAAATAVKG